jgi:hypothetical protein
VPPVCRCIRPQYTEKRAILHPQFAEEKSVFHRGLIQICGARPQNAEATGGQVFKRLIPR